MSPIAPAGRAKMKKGNADAVRVSATYIGHAPSETISHAAPTFCMNVPMSETTSARSRLRKVGVRNGRQRLGISGDLGMSLSRGFHGFLGLICAIGGIRGYFPFA